MRHDLVVCAYGDSPYLPECLHSLAQQQAQGTVITVSSSTPSPYQRSAAKAVGARFVANPQPPGIGSDWNFALSAAQGPLVTLCHQDDTYLPQFASRTHELFVAHTELILVSTGYVETLASGPRNPSLVLRIKRLLMSNAFRGVGVRHAREIRRRLLGVGNPISCRSVTLAKPLLGDFAFSISMRSNLDWDAWSRLAETPYEFGYIPDVLVTHRVHRGSATTQAIAENTRQREDLELFKRYWPRPVAEVLFSVYRRSYASNRVAG